jgi:hypothetical protein
VSEKSLYGAEEFVLSHVEHRLITKVDGLAAANCFICDTPVPDVLPPTSPIVTICLGDSNYDEATYLGAGPNALCEHSMVIITVLNRVVLDPPPKAREALMHTARGLLVYKRPILSALLLSDSQSCEGYADQFVPSGADGLFLIERGFIPRGWSAPRYVRRDDHQYLGMSLSLAFSFDQELNFT